MKNKVLQNIFDFADSIKIKIAITNNEGFLKITDEIGECQFIRAGLNNKYIEIHSIQ